MSVAGASPLAVAVAVAAARDLADPSALSSFPPSSCSSSYSCPSSNPNAPPSVSSAAAPLHTSGPAAADSAASTSEIPRVRPRKRPHGDDETVATAAVAGADNGKGGVEGAQAGSLLSSGGTGGGANVSTASSGATYCAAGAAGCGGGTAAAAAAVAPPPAAAAAAARHTAVFATAASTVDTGPKEPEPRLKKPSLKKKAQAEDVLDGRKYKRRRDSAPATLMPPEGQLGDGNCNDEGDDNDEGGGGGGGGKASAAATRGRSTTGRESWYGRGRGRGRGRGGKAGRSPASGLPKATVENAYSRPRLHHRAPLGGPSVASSRGAGDAGIVTPVRRSKRKVRQRSRGGLKASDGIRVVLPQ